MKKLVILSTLLVLFSSCSGGMSQVLTEQLDHLQIISSSSENEGSRYSSTDPTFSPYVNAFESYSRQYDDQAETINAQHVPINFDASYFKNEKGILAYCLSYDSGEVEIVVNPHTWSKLTEGVKEVLILHELGHCILGLAHDDAKDENGHPLSLMNSYLVYDFYYQTFRSELLHELFNDDIGQLLQKLEEIFHTHH